MHGGYIMSEGIWWKKSHSFFILKKINSTTFHLNEHWVNQNLQIGLQDEACSEAHVNVWWEKVIFHHCRQQFCDFKFESFSIRIRNKVDLKSPAACGSFSVSGLLSSEPEKLWLLLLQLVWRRRVWQDDNSVFMRGGDRGLFQHSGPLDPHQGNLLCFHFTLSASNSKRLMEELVAERGGPCHRRVQ